METTIVAIIGIGVGFLQAIVIFMLSGIKTEIADIWSRMNAHYHEVSCSNDDCKKLRTGNVIIPRG
ncbi:MAG: hypothetical protein ABIJ57_14965 [Pseudomonadota bacterium]